MPDQEQPARSSTPPAIRQLRDRGPLIIKIALGIAACVPSFVAYMGATSDAETKAEVVKVQAERVESKAESGYQVAVGELERLRAAVARLEAEVQGIKRSVRAIGKKTAVPVSTPAPAPAPAAPALPPTLDKALEQKPAPSEAK